MRKLFIIVVVSLISLNALANCNLSKLTETASLMAQRAMIMQAVAAYKWYHAPNHQATPYSAQQEIKILRSVNRLAKKIGIDPLSLMLFAQIQMDISKQIEAYWIDYWNNPNTPVNAKPTKATLASLQTLRRKIGHIDNLLMPQIKSDIPVIRQCSLKQLQPVFAHAFSKITGIPKQPSYIDILVKSFKQINRAN